MEENHASSDPEQVCSQVDQLNQQAEAALIDLEPDLMNLCDQALALAAPNGESQPIYPAGAAMSLWILGRSAAACSDYAPALDYYKKSLQIAEKWGLSHDAALGITPIERGVR